jgi:hypothetical protein
MVHQQHGFDLDGHHGVDGHHARKRAAVVVFKQDDDFVPMHLMVLKHVKVLELKTKSVSLLLVSVTSGVSGLNGPIVLNHAVAEFDTNLDPALLKLLKRNKSRTTSVDVISSGLMILVILMNVSQLS